MSKALIVFGIPALLFFLSCSDSARPPVLVEDSSTSRTKSAADVHDDGYDAPRMTLAHAKSEYDAGNAVIIDVRNEADYQQEHIKDALHIPLATLDARLDKIPKGKKIIAYCS